MQTVWGSSHFSSPILNTATEVFEDIILSKLSGEIKDYRQKQEDC